MASKAKVTYLSFVVILISSCGSSFEFLLFSLILNWSISGINLFSVVSIFGFFDSMTISILAMTMMHVKYHVNEVIFEEGSIGDSLFVIFSGEVECKNKAGFSRILKEK